MIQIAHLHKSFGKLKVLDDVSIQLDMGKSVALIGPNASGKTTLIKCLLGMVLPDAGNILFDGKNIHNDFSYRNAMGYMPQIGRYPENMKVSQVFDMLRNVRNHIGDFDEELIEAFDIQSIGHKY
ncbi:MAG: ATP-binding cassette domain-containing protein, partial [Chitinophagales bacterium]